MLKKKITLSYRPFPKDATWPTNAEGSHVHAASGNRRN